MLSKLRWRTPALAFILALAASAAAAQGVNRCEAADGRVTYSNEPCPPNSRTRAVNTEPPLRVDDSTAAKARASKDIEKARQLEKAQAKDDAQRRRASEQREQAEKQRQQRCATETRALDKLQTARERSALSAKQIQAADKAIVKQQRAVDQACKA